MTTKEKVVGNKDGNNELVSATAQSTINNKIYTVKVPNGPDMMKNAIDEANKLAEKESKG